MPQTLRECLLLIPSSGLDDFPESISSADSTHLLSGWLALWHPSLIAQTHSAPRWQSADQPPHDYSGVLAVAPPISQGRLPSDSAGTAQRGGGWLLAADRDWRTLQSDWLAQLPDAAVLPAATSAHWQTEFAALGYAYLQIQLLTRQLRYTSNLVQTLFDGQLDQAAAAALAGDAAQAEKMLQSCFDQLGQERDHYYSLDVSLLDITLLAPTTLGPAVEEQLTRQHTTTFVASGELLRQMHAQHPASGQALGSALRERRASLAGGLDIERPHPLMSFDAVTRDLARGRQAYQALGVEPPRVFTRFSYGQLVDMPLHLRRSGFIASMLIAWQDGVYPSGSHAKFSWEASEGTFLNAIAPPLADANDAATFLTLGRRIAEALDHQHVPVFMLAHWPSRYSPFFEMLERVVARTPALGRWQNADDFFDKTDQPYHQEHLPPRKFQYDWLSPTRGIEPECLIASGVAHQRFGARVRGLQNVLNLCYQLENFHSSQVAVPPPGMTTSLVASTGNTPADAAAADDDESEPDWPRAVALHQLDPELAEAADRVDAVFDASARGEGPIAALERTHARLSEKIGARFAKASGHRPASASSPPAAHLVVNAHSAPQRLSLTTPAELAPAQGANWLYATGRTSAGRLSLVDVPGYGMVGVPLRPPGAAGLRREQTLVQNDSLLLNDFLEAQVDPRTGGLRSLHVPGKRGNRLSVQLARREKHGTAAAEYSQAEATSVRTIENSSVLGTVRAQGRLLFRDQISGEFEIDYEVVRGSRVLAITVRLDALAALGSSAWAAAYVLRTAWPNESAVLTGRNCGSRQGWAGSKTVAPSLIEIDETDYRTYLLTGGLPFHQRVEQRFMETILAAGSARKGEFRFGIGVDLPNPVVASQQFLSEPLIVPLQAASGAEQQAAPAAWLMNIDAKHVVMQLEAPLVDQQGRCAGMRIHLSEIANKSVTARIRALREMSEAHRVDYLGGRVAKLTVEGDTASIALRPNEMTFVDLVWKV